MWGLLKANGSETSDHFGLQPSEVIELGLAMLDGFLVGTRRFSWFEWWYRKRIKERKVCVLDHKFTIVPNWLMWNYWYDGRGTDTEGLVILSLHCRFMKAKTNCFKSIKRRTFAETLLEGGFEQKILQTWTNVTCGLIFNKLKLTVPDTKNNNKETISTHRSSKRIFF